MQDIFEKYISAISSKFVHKETTELGYRTDFEILLKGIFETIKVTRFDHDAKADQGNKPDFVVLNHEGIVGDWSLGYAVKLTRNMDFYNLSFLHLLWATI